eukprot:8765269-Alexandrium_andersonii.AAC.1
MGMRFGEVLPAKEGAAAGTWPPDRRSADPTRVPPPVVAMARRAWPAGGGAPCGARAPRGACGHLRCRALGQVAAGREPRATDCQHGRVEELHKRPDAC